MKILLLLFVGVARAFVLEGSDNSFAKFKPWAHVVKSNNSLLLEFSTNQPDGLLLYSDDADAQSNFFELKLVEGSLRLRYNLFEGTQILSVGRHLNDGLWHRVEILISSTECSLTVDGFVTSGRNRHRDDGVWLGGNVFIGGLPSSYNDKLGELSLPSVVFEPRFRGAVRNVVYNSNHGVKPQELVEWKGLVSAPGAEACERHDPCLHGGFCISTDAGPICDCKHIDYVGVNCEREKPPPEATFTGNEHIGYDFRESGGQPIVSTLDEISFSFKTNSRNHDGLLFYSGDGVDYLALYIRDGKITISINLGSGPLDAKIHPDQIRFDDGLWHSISVHRKIQEMSKTTSLCHITASVDGLHFDRWTLAGSFTLLSSNRVTIGGFDMIRPLPGIKGISNFIGCLKKVEYRADTLRLGLLELAQTGNKLVSINGRVVFNCGGIMANVVTSAEVVKPMATTTITFTTPESFLKLSKNSTRINSLSLKLRTTEPNGLIAMATSDAKRFSMAIELIDGQVMVHVTTSVSHLRIQATTDPIDDGEWHQIKFVRLGRSGSVAVDEISTDFNTKGPDSVTMGMMTIFIGGSDRDQPEVWSMNLKYGFVGCLRGLVVNDDGVDMGIIAQQQDTGSVRTGCHVGSAGHCAGNPCLNNGRCNDGWGRFYCDCSVAGDVDKGFDGVVCQRLTTPIHVENVVKIPHPMKPTESHDIILRFKASTPNGVILSLTGVNDFVEISMEQGRIKLRVKMGDREKSLATGLANLDLANVVVVQRRGNLIRLKHGDAPHQTTEILTRNWAMTTDQLYLGSMTTPTSCIISYLSINNVNLLSTKNTLVDAITLPTYVALPQMRIYAHGVIYLSFKSHGNGLIFYNGGVKDFISFELVNGALISSVECGSGVSVAKTRTGYDDGGWHDVKIIVECLKSSLIVDGERFGDSFGENNYGETLDLNGVLYLGGLPANMYGANDGVKSRQGFGGCVASLEFGGEYLNPGADALVNQNSVAKCVASNSFCDSCRNGGACDKVCDCDMTSYTGSDCSLESTTYELGGGYMTYKARSFRPEKIRLAFGLVTTDVDGSLLRVEMGADYIHFDLVNGKLRVRCFFGSSSQSFVSEARVNDRAYRVIRLQRSGHNMTLSIDKETWTSRIKQSQMTTSVAMVTIGSDKKKGARGLISGLVINGDRILDYARERDPRVKVFGVISHVASIATAHVHHNLIDYMQKTTASLQSNLHDDLIYSGDTKCQISDDEDCFISSGMTTDELITPVYVPTPKPKSTAMTTTTTTKKTPTSLSCDDDDEDCNMVHSGEGEMTTTTTGMTTVTTTGTTTTTTTTTTSTTTITPMTTTPTTTTAFVPPHPPSLAPYVVPTGDEFDFPTQPPPHVVTTHGDNPTIYVADSSGESTLIIIIILAVLMIVIVSVLIIFFMCRRGESPIYKSYPQQQPMLATSAPQQVLQQRPKPGVKEWYV